MLAQQYARYEEEQTAIAWRPTAPVQAVGQVRGTATTRFDNNPHINVGTYDLASMKDADVQFVADRLDVMLGNTVRAGDVKARNAHPLLFSYMDLTAYNNGAPSTGRDGHTDTKITNFVADYNAAHDPNIDAEDLYLHAKCDCDMLYGTTGHCSTYNASDPKCTQTAGCPYSFITGTKTQYYGWNPTAPGTPNAGCLQSTATSRAGSRMMTAYLPQWDVPNYLHPALDDYFADTATKENIGWASPGSLDGVFFDTVVLDNHTALANGLHMSHEYWGIDVRSTTQPTRAFSDYFALQNSVQTQLAAKQGQSGFRWPGNVISIPNEYPLSIFTNDTLAHVPEFFVEIFFDGVKNGANTFQPECGLWKSLIDETSSKQKNVLLNAYEHTGTSCSNSADCRTDRGKIESLAMYYLVARPVSATKGTTAYLYAADVTNGSYEQQSWNAATSIDIGQPATMPSGAKDIFGNTGTSNFYNFSDPTSGFTCPITSTALSSIVYGRRFTNGLVLVKHRHDYSDTVYGDGGSSDTTKSTYVLDDTYHPVQADGALGAATTTVTLSNSQGAILLKNRAPALTPLDDRTSTEEQPITFDVAATDADGDAVTLNAVNLPLGATFLANGTNKATFRWTPSLAQAGTYSITFQARDASATGSSTMTIAVNNQNQAPAFTSKPASQTIDEGVLLAFTVAATDPDGDAVTFVATKVPSGATFTAAQDDTATFKWKPTNTQAGAYTVHMEASDGTASVGMDVSITVRDVATAPIVNTPANDPPVLSAIPDATGTVGAVLAFAVAATDPDTTTIKLRGSGLPSGATFTDHKDGTGTFRWVPSRVQAKTYPNVRFEANDGKLKDSQTITITIQPNATAPAVGGAFPDSKNFSVVPKTLTRGGFSVASGNVWGDVRDDIVIGLGEGHIPQVRVYSNDGTLRGRFFAYPISFRGGVDVAVCDVNGDGKKEIVTAPGPGRPPTIQVFSAQGRRLRQFWVLDGKTQSGVHVTCGDTNRDGRDEIVAAPASGGGTVTVHRENGGRIAQFSPFGKTFRGGLHVASIRRFGQPSDELIAAPASGGGTVRLMSARGKRVVKEFRPFPRSYRGGITLATGDTDGNGFEEIFAGTTPKTLRTVMVLEQQKTRPVRSFAPYGKSAVGARLAIGDIDADGHADVIVTPASGGISTVRLLDGSGRNL